RHLPPRQRARRGDAPVRDRRGLPRGGGTAAGSPIPQPDPELRRRPDRPDEHRQAPGLRMTVRIAFLGDTLLGAEGQAAIDRFGYGYALDGIRSLLEGADLVVANHEGPLPTLEHPAEKSDTGRKRYWYRGLPAAAAALAGAGVRVVSLANNHIMDFGL